MHRTSNPVFLRLLGLLAPIALMVPLCGCAATGGERIPQNLDWLQLGSTSEAQLVEELGEPGHLRERADGHRYLTYSWFEIGMYGGPFWDESEFVTFTVREGAVRAVDRGEYW